MQVEQIAKQPLDLFCSDGERLVVHNEMVLASDGLPSNTYIYVYTYLYTYIYLYLYTCIYIYLSLSIYTYLYTYTYIIYIYKYVRMYACERLVVHNEMVLASDGLPSDLYMYVHIYLYTQIYLYIYIVVYVYVSNGSCV